MVMVVVFLLFAMPALPFAYSFFLLFLDRVALFLTG